MKVELSAKGFAHRQVINDRVEVSDALFNLELNSDQVKGDIQLRNGGPLEIFKRLGGLTRVDRIRFGANTIVSVVRQTGGELVNVHLQKRGFRFGRDQVLTLTFDQVGRKEPGLIAATRKEYGGTIDGRGAEVIITPGQGMIGSIAINT